MKHDIKDYVDFGKLSIQKDVKALEGGFSGWVEDGKRDSLAVFNTLYSASFFAILEFSENILRGNHYHLEKEETIIVLRGELSYRLWLVEGSELLTGVLKKGEYVRISPLCAHSFVSEKGDALALEYGNVRYSEKDVIKVE